MTTGFKVGQIGNYNVDIDDILMRREYFSDGTLWALGNNGSGQLGDGTVTNRSSPVTTAGGGTNWKQVAGGNHTAAIKTDRTLWIYGYNANGQLGDGTVTNRSSPVTTAGGGTNWKQVACGLNHTAAIKTDGTLWTWGLNSGYFGSGMLGDGTTTARSSPGTTIGGGTNWKQVACGNAHTAAVKSDGTLWTWGNNGNGELGDGTITARSSPGTTIGGGTNWKQVACGGNHTAAVKTDGTLWTWGYNWNGRLGDGTATNRSSPGTTAGGGKNWKQVACSLEGGGIFSQIAHVAAVKTDGTLWTWGYNAYGQLGTGNTADTYFPGTTAGGGTNWKQVSIGFLWTAAVKTDGTLWTWGYNNSGQLGTGGTTNRSSPGTTSGGGTNWKQVACGYYHLAATTDLSV